MPIAAVPSYLGQDFSDASPGLRYGLLLPIWTTRQDQETEVRRRAEQRSREGQEVAAMLDRQGMEATILALQQRDRNRLPKLWEKNDNAAKTAWDQIKTFSARDRALMQALVERQASMADRLPAGSLLRLDAVATAPFTTGLGNEHPLENGFAFLNPYGLPYLPGSGVKGVLRQAARELASGDWGDRHGWDAAAIDALFGKEDSNVAQRGALAFWDVIPLIKGNSLMVEIMTPHQGHYYQQRQIAGSTSPHDSGQPIPISYLTLPPGSSFCFYIVCDNTFLCRVASQLAGHWKDLMTAALEHAFVWLGFGAKTAAGYGVMQRDAEAEHRAAQAKAEREAQLERQRAEDQKRARMEKFTLNQRKVEEFIEQAKKRYAQLRGAKEKQNTGLHSEAQRLCKLAIESGDWKEDEKFALAQAVEEWLPKIVERFDQKNEWKEGRKKLKLATLKGEN